MGEIKIIKHTNDLKNNWTETKAMLNKVKLYTNLKELKRDSKKPEYTSLALFKPARILDFIYEKQDPNWSREENKQLELFYSNELKRVEKLPFKFKYEFEDDEGKHSNLMIDDWELGALFLKYKQDYKLACEKVKEKYFKKDLLFFLGTTKRHHNRSRNPFMIIGTFPSPKISESK